MRISPSRVTTDHTNFCNSTLVTSTQAKFLSIGIFYWVHNSLVQRFIPPENSHLIIIFLNVNKNLIFIEDLFIHFYVQYDCESIIDNLIKAIAYGPYKLNIFIFIRK